MDIYRHKLSSSEYTVFSISGNQRIMNENEHFSNILTNLGFCSLDGTDVIADISGQNGFQEPFRWKYDLSNNYWIEGTRNNSTGNPVQGLWFTNDAAKTGSQALVNGILTGNFYNNYQSIIFIPLKNNGFILETYRFSGNPDETEANPTLQLIKSRLSSFTPKFFTVKDYLSTTIISTYTFWVDYLIGIPDNISSTNSFVYLFFNGTQSYFFKNKDINLNYIPNVDTSANMDYVNKNANICTLIPYPYENSFIDGLYLATTIPGDTIEGKFFSFGGRNYLGVYKNLVVELLPN